MASFLTTSRMEPALRQRIEASIRGRQAQMGRPLLSPRVVALLRVVLVAAVGFGLYAFIGARRRDQKELEAARSALLATVQHEAATLTPEDRLALVRVDSWLVRAAGPYEGDLVTDELRRPGALAATLARPIVYVRGPLGGFVNPARIDDAAHASTKDALLVCLMEPPASKVEKVMLGTVRIAYTSAAVVEQHTPNARRLNDARLGLPLMLPQYAAHIAAATDGADLARIRRELEHAPLDRAKQALRANVLVFAMDEPSDGGGPTELDGERAHAVRIAIVDLTTNKVLLRVRELVDPTWISLARKSEYASGLDSCGLAFDVHEQLRAVQK